MIKMTHHRRLRVSRMLSRLSWVFFALFIASTVYVLFW